MYSITAPFVHMSIVFVHEFRILVVSGTNQILDGQRHSQMPTRYGYINYTYIHNVGRILKDGRARVGNIRANYCPTWPVKNRQKR